SGTTSLGDEITTTDFTKADIVVSESMSMKPATGQQTFDIGYFPKETVPDVYKGEKGLENAVVPTSTIDAEIIDGGVYKIKNLNSGKYLLSQYADNWGNVFQGSSTGNAQELWTIKPDDNGYYNLVNGNGFYLDVDYCSAENGTNIKTYSMNYNNAQDYKLDKQADGSYAILTRASRNKSGLEVDGSSIDDNANVMQYEFTGGANQKWVLECQSSSESLGTDKNGKYTLENPFIGEDWSFTAIAPKGYYTQWVNMTGDADNDGYISESEAKASRGKSVTMPDEVYGNKLSGQLDQDNFKLNYYFLPKTGEGNGKKTGTVTRAPENFYELAHNITSSDISIPVAGAYVDIGGFIGMTDGKGDYSIACNDLPSAGNVSTTITADGSTSYYTVSKLQRYTPIELPSISKFKAVATDAKYATKDKLIDEDFVTVDDDALTISATVSSESALTPTQARFFIYDNAGNEKFACEGRAGYTVTTETMENQFTANLTFNPKKDMQFGYKIYVQFADQNKEWTNAIDLGYYFSSKLNLAEFVFPLLGSSSLEDTITTGFVADIIGNPLGDMDIGAINGFEENSSKYTPSGINKKDASKFTWQNTDYSYGWSKNFYDIKKSTGAEKDESKLKKYLKEIYDGKSKGKEPPAPSKYATKSKFKWSVTPSVGFNLTLSSRKDGNTYFEDLVFYVKVDFDASASQTIQLPIGISVLIKGGLSGDAVGIYHMYVDYQDSAETEDAVKYTSEDFGIFKKFNNSVRREGYIFINPKISVALGVGLGIIFVTGNASFNFDMDFQFTEIGTNTYGDITIDLGWGIQLAGFEIYSKSLYDTTEKMFNSQGQNGHIDFDYANANKIALETVADYFATDGDEKLILDKPASRDYLENRSEWLGGDTEINLMAIDGSEGTIENPLVSGITDSPYVQMLELDNGEILMMFIDDDIKRSDVNKRALYYSIYNGTTWSEPVQVDNDGTPDDYPTMCDLGNGEIFIAWSSAENVLPNDATVEDTLKSMNIKGTFFNKVEKQIGKIDKITKTTTQDYTADVMPNVAYDSATGKMLLYYTKTEYDNLKNLTDISKAYSVNAYMFYDTNAHTWSNANDYTSTELEGMSEDEKAKYKENWYGQRFLDLRLDKTSKNMPRIVDTSAISYNGLGLFAWTVDWDKSLDTVNDRDVFMQVYNFTDNSFTHIMRATPQTGAYTTPKFERSKNATYLFFGAKDAESDHGEIQYLNISDIIKNNKFTLFNDGGNSAYYIFEYVREAVTTVGLDKENNEIPIDYPSETVLVEPRTATLCDNTNDYDVNVSADGQMYLFWTDEIDDARQIMVSTYNGTDVDDDNGETGNQPGANLSEIFWSEPIVLTNGKAKTYYSGIGTAVVNGEIIAASAKGDYDNKSLTSLVWQKHKPFSKIKTSSLFVNSEYPQPSSKVDLIATVKNEGLATMYATEQQPVTVTFTMNGSVVGTNLVKTSIAGGATIDVLCTVELPEDLSNVEFTAYVNQAESVSTKIEQKEYVTLIDNKIGCYSPMGYDEQKVLYSGKMENSGNATVNNVVVTAMAGKTEVGKLTIDSLESNETKDLDISLDIPDSAYTINESGVGSVQINFVAVSSGETVANYSGNVEKVFNTEAISLLDKVTEIKFKNSGNYTAKPGEKKEIQPTINGVDSGKLAVKWLNSSDSNIAYIDYDNMIIADEKGTATITGIVIPNEERIEFGASGHAQEVDWSKLIPADKLVTVTAKVEVYYGSGGGNGGGSSTKYTVTFETNDGIDIAPIKVNKNGTITDIPTPVKKGCIFGGWYTDEALTQIFTKDTTVTTNLKLYAKWTEDTSLPEIDEYVNPFIDVSMNDWFYDSVKYAYNNKLLKGVSDNEFAPNSELTRAMLVTVLYRAEGEPEVKSNVSFNDVLDDSYYVKAVAWAKENGIVTGITDNEFAPEENIKREQIAAIMFRYAKLKGNITEGEATTNLTYKDSGDVSDWAIEAVMFCTLKGIMHGNENNKFMPLDNATRAETAAISQRCMESLNEK
ncbi:MAG: S-layer homology domain-containing protein, partial [Oscillospiraceae bacterium]